VTIVDLKTGVFKSGILKMFAGEEAIVELDRCSIETPKTGKDGLGGPPILI
jgi:hypothetical protein